MKVLTVMYDVSKLSEDEIVDLQLALEVQGEDLDTEILNSGVRTIEETDD